MSDDDRLMGHQYDGIQEYDNPLPGWWKAVFLITIVISPIYAWWFHFGGPGKTIHQEFDRDWAAYLVAKAEAEQRNTLVVNEDVLTTMAHDPAVLAAGRQIFVEKCVGCHMDDGRGNIGANLTDGFQIHGVARLDLYTTIRDGVSDKGMIAWGQTMVPREMATVAAYVSSLRGHPVAGGKDAQGVKVGAFE